MSVLQDAVGVKICQFGHLTKETLSMLALSLVSLTLPLEHG